MAFFRKKEKPPPKPEIEDRTEQLAAGVNEAALELTRIANELSKRINQQTDG